jgi:hypothetical protein
MQYSMEPAQAPTCMKCRTSMWVVQIEDFPGRSRRTYQCPDCLQNTTTERGLNMRECIAAEVD